MVSLHQENVLNLGPSFFLPSFSVISNSQAFSLGIICAFVFGRFGKFNSRSIVGRCITCFMFTTNIFKKICDFFLQKYFLPPLPLFTAGFVIKLLHEKKLSNFFLLGKKFVFLSAITMIAYLGILFICTFFIDTLRKWQENLASFFLPVSTAFCTMSSVGALPFTIKSIERNSRNKELCVAVANSTVTTYTNVRHRTTFYRWKGDAVTNRLSFVCILVCYHKIFLLWCSWRNNYSDDSCARKVLWIHF